MEISERSWQGYINALRKVNDKASAEILNWLKNHGIPQGREAMNGLIDFAYAVSTTYGEAAAELAAEMYEATAALSGVIIEPAVPAATPAIRPIACPRRPVRPYSLPRNACISVVIVTV